MRTPMAALLTISTACLLTACGDRSVKYEGNPADAPPASSRNAEAPVQPDNTGVNTRDVNSENPTAADQSETPADRDMTQRIRQAVVADDSLSIGAQNVKIITIAGRVTLRGPVSTDAEKMTIERKAIEIAGATKVDNQIEVKR